MIFFTDLDDTLLNRNKKVSPGNRRAIEAVLHGGHYICICTGRALPSALREAHRLGLDGKGCFCIAFNGSQIYDCEKKELILRKGLDPEVVRYLFDEAKAFPIHIQTYDEKGIVAENDAAIMHVYSSYQNLPISVTDDFRKLVPDLAPKMLAVESNPEKLSAFREYITPKVKGKADIFLSHSDLLEFVPPNVNKGEAVRFLCEYLGLPITASVAAGDAENDLTMLEAAHVGCCMCNGDPRCKEKADYVTENDCDHDGVAEILEKFVLGKQV